MATESKKTSVGLIIFFALIEPQFNYHCSSYKILFKNLTYNDGYWVHEKRKCVDCVC